MTINWKHKTGVLALSVAMLSVSAGAQVAPAGKPVKAPVEEVVQPAPSVDVETGQMLDKGPRRPPSVKKGIKDKGMTSCGNCGLTGKEADPPPVDDAAAPAPSVDVETGQCLDKGPGRGCGNSAPGPNSKATERRAHSGPGGTPPSTAKKGSNTGLILGITAGAAALAAILASGNNDDNPTSP